MKKTFFLFLFLSTTLVAAPCFPQNWPYRGPLGITNALIPEFRLSYFYPCDGALRSSYHTKGGINYHLGLMTPLYPRLYAWVMASYFSKTKDFSFLESHSRLSIVPVNVGLKYFFPILPFKGCFYVEGAARFFHVSLDHNPAFGGRSVNRNGVGGLVGLGGLWKVAPHLHFELFSDFSYKRLDFAIRSYQVGGWDGGGGVTYTF